MTEETRRSERQAAEGDQARGVARALYADRTPLEGSSAAQPSPENPTTGTPLASPSDYQQQFRRRWLYVPLESALIAGTVVVLAYVLDAGGTNASASEYWQQIASLGREEFRGALIQLQTIFASIMLGVIFVRRSRVQPGEMTIRERLQYLMIVGQREAIIEGVVLYVAILSGAATILYGVSAWVASMTEQNVATSLYVITVAFIAVPVILYLLTGAIEIGEVAATRRYAVILTALRHLALWRGEAPGARRSWWSLTRFFLSSLFWVVPALIIALFLDHDRELARPMITVFLLALAAGLTMVFLMPRVIAGVATFWRSFFLGLIALLAIVSLQGFAAIVGVTSAEPSPWRELMVGFSLLYFLAMLYRLLLLSGTLRSRRERTRRWIESWVAVEVQRRCRDLLEESEQITSDSSLDPAMRDLVQDEFLPRDARVRPAPPSGKNRSQRLGLLESQLEAYLPAKSTEPVLASVQTPTSARLTSSPKTPDDERALPADPRLVDLIPGLDPQPQPAARRRSTC